MKKKFNLGRNFIATILVIGGISFLYPLFWLILTSFKSNGEVYSNSYGFPHQWGIDNYLRVFTQFDYVRFFINSCIYSAFSVLLTLLCATLFAYATARMEWRLKNLVLSYIQFGLVIPSGVTLLGTYYILTKSALRNTYPGLIFPYVAIAIPLAVVILYGFFRSLPFSLEESAYIDGATIFTAFFKIILPMIAPAIATVTTIVFINTWNEYTLAFITVDSNKMKSLPVGIASFMTTRNGDWGGMAAALLLASIPTIIIYLIFSEKLENALTTSSAIK